MEYLRELEREWSCKKAGFALVPVKHGMTGLTACSGKLTVLHRAMDGSPYQTRTMQITSPSATPSRW